jgi:hypothetical protein
MPEGQAKMETDEMQELVRQKSPEGEMTARQAGQ